MILGKIEKIQVYLKNDFSSENRINDLRKFKN